MSGPMRWILSVLMMVCAVVLTLVATLGAFANHVVNDPEPARQILGPLPTDPVLRELLPQEVATQLTDRIPEALPLPNVLKRILADGITTSAGALLDDPGFQTSWVQTIDQSRAGYITELEAVKAGTATEATLKLDIGPLVDSTYGVLLQSLEGSALGALLPAAGNQPVISIDTGFPAADTVEATTLASLLGWAGNWMWAAVAAAVLAVGSLLVASRRIRGYVLAGGGVLVLVAGVLLMLWSGGLAGTDPGNQDLQQVVTHRVLSSLSAMVSALAGAVAIGGGIATALGLGWFWLGRRSTAA